MQVLICTYGADGISRVATCNHPQVDGVRWMVCWQNPEHAPLPESLQRDDMEIVQTDTVGLSLNRNISLKHAADDIVVISDDDVVYTPEQLQRIAQLFRQNPYLDVITYRYSPTEACYQKQYPEPKCFNLKRPARGYYVTSFEMALRLKAQREAKVWFDERFGIGSPLFICGEEQLFLHRLMRKGLHGNHIGEELCMHTGGPTTSERLAADPRTVEANAATKVVMHPLTWLPRQVVWAFRQKNIPKFRYIAASIRGAYKLFKSWITRYPKTRTYC